MGYKNDDPCIKEAYPDERLFVLMARDPAAPRCILQWISGSIKTQPPDKIREALECALEMLSTGDTFRKRKEEDEKKRIAAQERDEFDQWKKMKDGKGPLTPLPNAANVDLGNYEEALFNKVKTVDIEFARRFANFLDQGFHSGQSKRYVMLFDEFLKTLPSR